MKRQKAGKLDRHIQIQVAGTQKDAANDETPIWTDWKKLWAEKRERGAFREVSAPHEVLRDSDTIFVLRRNSISTQIAPETYRITYQGRIWEIVGIAEGPARDDTIYVLASFRPDGRGARAPEQASGNP